MSPTATPTVLSRSVRLFAGAWEIVFAALWVVGMLRFLSQDHTTALDVVVVGTAIVLAGWRIAWFVLRRVGTVGPAPGVELAGTVVLTVVLMALAPDFVWVAFPVFLWCFQYWPPRVAVPVVTVLAAAAIATGVAHARSFDLGQVLGPLIGAVVAAVMALGYKSLAAENDQRRRLIEDLERTREHLATTEREAATLAERQRIAREVHDTVTQGLSSIAMLLQAADAQLDADPSRSRRHIDLALRTARENLEESRRFVRALTSPSLDDAPLDAAIADACRRFEEETGIDARFSVAGEPRPLGAEHQLALFRVAQGALGNVRRHSGATRVDVTVTFQDDVVNLDVVDDGSGFDPVGARNGGGFGLTAMAERLGDIDGTLVVESAPGSGTAVAASLPTGPIGAGSP